MSYFKNGELYNVDRSWGKFSETVAILDKYPWAIKQALIKSPVKKELLECLNNHPQKYMYMPIVYSKKEIEKVLSYSAVNTVGMELIAGKIEDELFQDETIKYLHGKRIFAWVNSITLSGLPQHILFGSLDDDTALLKDKDSTWGQIMWKGVDVIQTDWPLQLKE